MIKSPIKLWNLDLNAVPAYDPQNKRSRVIKLGPLINLEALKALICGEGFDTDQLWVATDKCEHDLQKERWSAQDVLQMLVNLDGSKDYKQSEWCQVLGGRMVACDAYTTFYDSVRGDRNSKALPVYLKFSVDEDGLVTIALVSCHAS